MNTDNTTLRTIRYDGRALRCDDRVGVRQSAGNFYAAHLELPLRFALKVQRITCLKSYAPKLAN